MNLTEKQIERYSRQLLLPGVGGAGQRRLLSARVLVAGAGGLGSPVALYLAAAGVGHLGVVDSDTVELSNLQRQVLHRTRDLGRPKADSARETLTALNPEIEVVAHSMRLSAANARELIAGYDVVVDGSDNLATRYLLSDACVLTGKPLSHGGILRFEGQAITLVPGRGPCYRCLFPEPPPPGAVPSCQEAGVLGPTAGVIGAIQATEVLKLILGIGDILYDRLLIYDGLAMSCRLLPVARRADCAACGDRPTVTELVDYQAFCGLPAASEVS